jgi:hypothetical protein
MMPSGLGEEHAYREPDLGTSMSIGARHAGQAVRLSAAMPTGRLPLQDDRSMRYERAINHL